MNDKTELNGHSVVACTYSSEDMSSFDYASGIDAADVLASLSQEVITFINWSIRRNFTCRKSILNAQHTIHGKLLFPCTKMTYVVIR